MNKPPPRDAIVECYSPCVAHVARVLQRSHLMAQEFWVVAVWPQLQTGQSPNCRPLIEEKRRPEPLLTLHPQPYRCSPVGQVGHCAVYKPFLSNNTFARAHVLINENLQLSVCFNQTSLPCRRHEYHLQVFHDATPAKRRGLCRQQVKKNQSHLHL